MKKLMIFAFLLVFLMVGTSMAFSQVTLKALMEDVPETRIIEKLLPDFEAKTGIKVQFEIVQYSDMHAKLVPQLMSPNCQYDFLEVDNYWAGEFPAAGWLLDLGPYVKKDNFDISVYLPSMLNMVGYYHGKLYMIPMYNYAMGLIYRKDLLNNSELKKKWKEEYGTELVLPNSVEGYVKLASFMQKNADVYGSAMQAQRGDPIVMEWCNYLFSVGGDFYDKNWKPIINNEKGVKALKLYKEALKEAAPPGALSFNLDDSFRIMSQGKAFSMITYNWMLAQLDDPEVSKVAGKVGLAPMPGGVGLNGGWGWAIPKNSAHKKEAWEFIKWVESFDIAKKRALSGGAPTRKDVFGDKDVLAKYPWYKDVETLLSQAKPVPEFQYSAQMIEVTGRELSLACADQKDIKKALDTVAKELLKLSKMAGLAK